MEYIVSEKAAEVALAPILRALHRSETKEKVMKLAEETKIALQPKKLELINYANSPCSQCGRFTLMPIGVKYLCRTCDFMSDNLQDGDSV